MSPWGLVRPGRILPALSLLLLGGCDASGGPRAGGLTNWLRACERDADCGDLRCLCGACTLPCDAAAACADLDGTACVGAEESGAVALCGGDAPASPGLCLQRCSDDECGTGAACVAGVCSPLPEPTAHVTIDTGRRYQTLLGLGAGVTYMNDDLAAHPLAADLYDVLFLDSGFELLRLRNRHGVEDAEDLTSSAEIVAAATARLGHPPTTLLTSFSPPAALKANGSTRCEGTPDTCTLVRLDDGAFDYPGFAAHWRASLQAYAAAGIVPDFIGLQNNPDSVPPDTDALEACRFLPTEGTATVTIDGASVEAAYPGFDQALTAVVAAIADLDPVPRILAPETTGFGSVAEYLPHLDLASVDALAFHLYGTDPADVDVDGLRDLAALGQTSDRPLLQTEMQSDGLGTAVLAHHALVDGGATAYLQNDLVGAATAPDGSPLALVAIDAEGFTIRDPYHSLRHWARFTEPGWVRVAADDEADDLLASAWLAPTDDALTVVLVNSGSSPLAVELARDEATPMRAEVTRTVFDGVERSADLGALPPAWVVRVPGRAIVTVAFTP